MLWSIAFIAAYVIIQVLGDRDRICLPNSISGQYITTEKEFYAAESENVKIKYRAALSKLITTIGWVSSMRDEITELGNTLKTLTDTQIIKDDVGRNIKVLKVTGNRLTTPLNCAVLALTYNTKGYLPGFGSKAEFEFWERKLKEFNLSQTFTDITPRKSPPGFYSKGRFLQAFGAEKTYQDVKDKGAILIKIVNKKIEIAIEDSDDEKESLCAIEFEGNSITIDKSLHDRSELLTGKLLIVLKDWDEKLKSVKTFFNRPLESISPTGAKDLFSFPALDMIETQYETLNDRLKSFDEQDYNLIYNSYRTLREGLNTFEIVNGMLKMKIDRNLMFQLIDVSIPDTTEVATHIFIKTLSRNENIINTQIIFGIFSPEKRIRIIQLDPTFYKGKILRDKFLTYFKGVPISTEMEPRLDNCLENHEGTKLACLGKPFPGSHSCGRLLKEKPLEEIIGNNSACRTKPILDVFTIETDEACDTRLPSSNVKIFFPKAGEQAKIKCPEGNSIFDIKEKGTYLGRLNNECSLFYKGAEIFKPFLNTLANRGEPALRLFTPSQRHNFISDLIDYRDPSNISTLSNNWQVIILVSVGIAGTGLLVTILMSLCYCHHKIRKPHRPFRRHRHRDAESNIELQNFQPRPQNFNVSIDNAGRSRVLSSPILPRLLTNVQS